MSLVHISRLSFPNHVCCLAITAQQRRSRRRRSRASLPNEKKMGDEILSFLPRELHSYHIIERAPDACTRKSLDVGGGRFCTTPLPPIHSSNKMWRSGSVRTGEKKARKNVIQLLANQEGWETEKKQRSPTQRRMSTGCWIVWEDFVRLCVLHAHRHFFV